MKYVHPYPLSELKLALKTKSVGSKISWILRGFHVDFAWIVASVSYEQLGQIVEQFLLQNKVKVTLKESSTR